MLATDSIRRMPRPKVPRPESETTRLAVADVVEYLIGDVELKKKEVIAGARNMSESTLYRILRGDKVGDQMLWRLAKSLGVPTATFTLIVEGDAEGIENLVSLDADSKRYILNVLSRMGLSEDQTEADA